MQLTTELFLNLFLYREDIWKNSQIQGKRKVQVKLNSATAMHRSIILERKKFHKQQAETA